MSSSPSPRSVMAFIVISIAIVVFLTDGIIAKRKRREQELRLLQSPPEPTNQASLRQAFSSVFSPSAIVQAVNQADELFDGHLPLEQQVTIYRTLQDSAGQQFNSGWPVSLVSERVQPVNVGNTSTMTAVLVEKTTQILVAKRPLMRYRITYHLPRVGVRAPNPQRNCTQHIERPCRAHQYRSFNGHCNNVEKPSWGSSGTPYGRFLPAQYSDGVSKPRTHSALTRRPLPSAKDVSDRVYNDTNRAHSHANVMFVALAEFVALDLAGTPSYSSASRVKALRCCAAPLTRFEPDCFPIHVTGDAEHRNTSSCLPYVRSPAALQAGCAFGPREQLNKATSFIDASPLYGNTQKEADALRSFRKGRLRVDAKSSSEIAPRMSAERFPNICRGGDCFLAGDMRVNGNAPLTSMHTLWLREHNRVARALALLNPHWGDYLLFEEARRIVIAELQHIVYAEMLPALVGVELTEKYRLRPLTTGYSEEYNIGVDASTANEVATAVLPFVASMMPGHVELKELRGSRRTSNVSKTFRSADNLHEHIDQLVMGMLTQRGQSSGTRIAVEMNASPGNSSGSTTMMMQLPDLVSTLIQRGRDHAIPSYTSFRRLCGLKSKFRRFDQLNTIMPKDTVKKLASVYSSVDDIDLLVGGLAETPRKGALVGPTFACLIGRQFQNAKRGDRFYYEFDLPPSAFSPEQLKQIRRTSLARIICDNIAGSDEQLELQPAALTMPDPYLNDSTVCSSSRVKRVDLSAWRSKIVKDFAYRSGELGRAHKLGRLPSEELLRQRWLE